MQESRPATTRGWQHIARAGFVLFFLLAINQLLGADTVREDQLGDPLPEGAIARIGTLRWWYPATRLTYSPDGRWLAATGGHTVIFDASTGAVQFHLKRSANYVFFSADSKTVITLPYGLKPEVAVWDVATGKERRHFTLEGGANLFADCSADARTLVSGSSPLGPRGGRAFLEVWDTENGKRLARTEGLGGGQLLLAPDGKAVFMRDGYQGGQNILMKDVFTGKELRSFPSGFNGNAGRTLETRDMAVSADGKTLVCSEGDKICLLETATAKVRSRLVNESKDILVSVATTPDARLVAAGTSKGDIHIWEAASDKPRHSIHVSETELPIYLLAFSPDGKSLAIQQHLVPKTRVWDVVTGKERTASNRRSPFACFAFVPGSNEIASLDMTGSLDLWNVTTGKLASHLGTTQPTRIDENTLVVSPDGKLLIHCAGQSCHPWDLTTKKPLSASQGNRRFFPILLSDSKTVLTTFAGAEKRRDGPREPVPADRGPRRPPVTPRPMHETMIGLWDISTAKEIRSFAIDADHMRLTVSDDRRFLVGSAESLFVWDLATGREIRRIQLEAHARSNIVALSADNRTLIVGPVWHREQGKYLIHLWEVATGKERAAVPCAAGQEFHPTLTKGRLTALTDGTSIYLMDTMTGEELHRFSGHISRIDTMTFSPDGRFLVSGSQDTTALVWDLDGLVRASKEIRLSDQELKDRWADLHSDDARKAFRAIGELAQARGQAVTFLQKHLRPARQGTIPNLEQLIAALDSDEFTAREKATQELTNLGPVAEKALTRALAGKLSLEARRRVEGILEKLKQLKGNPVPTGELLRSLRAVEVLEQVATPDAERLLGELAKGVADSPLTDSAEIAREHLKRIRAKP